MNKRSFAIARAVAVIGGTGALIVGVTFAAGLTSTATLAGTSESTASANLGIWNGSAFASSAPGFNITNLVPGTGVTDNMYLQNSGGVPLAVTANVPTLPTSSGFSGWNNATVSITAENTSATCNNAPGFTENTGTAGTSNTSPYTVNTNLADLNSGQVILPCIMNVGDTGNSGVAGTPGNYDVHFDIAESSITGSSATVGPFDIVLTGTQTP
ncbi:MAG TPA: hypothetical protein VMS08_04835 [Candidatus Saccharimonadia bacterium]|nr:hypothetical protein [Candidatus Saccharimonadia bacterium]